MTPRSLLGAALRYAASGWRVFPVSADKSPLTAHGFKDASADERLIRQWWDTTPTANIGLAIPEGLVVLDFDPRNGAPHPYNDLNLRRGHLDGDTAALRRCVELGLPIVTNDERFSRDLGLNTTGGSNTALGWSSLFYNKTGFGNTGAGFGAVLPNTTGMLNSGLGYSALLRNRTGRGNSAVGAQAAYWNYNGHDNSAFGYRALFNNISGHRNIAVGLKAGSYQTTGSDNIYLANFGVAGESGRIRIGSPGAQTATFVSGIAGTPLAGSTVVVNGAGQLGVAPSSERFKEGVEDMGDTSAGLMALRPVRFQYRMICIPASIFSKAVSRYKAGRGFRTRTRIRRSVSKKDPGLIIHSAAWRHRGCLFLLGHVSDQSSRWSGS